MTIEWMWIGVGYVIGISCGWIVSDLVYPIKRK
jgi:hypothetical protein